MAKNVIVNFVSDEEGMLSVEVIKNISEWMWFGHLMNEHIKVDAENAVDKWSKSDTQNSIVDEENFEDCCKEFKDAVQSYIDEAGGIDHCMIQYLTWSVEYDTNLACLICIPD